MELSYHIIVLSLRPRSVIPPPSAVVSDGTLTEPISIFLSSTVRVVELIVVVVPSTVRLPLTLIVAPVEPLPRFMVAVDAPSVIEVAAAPMVNVVAFASNKLAVAAVVLRSPPFTFKSPASVISAVDGL